MWTMIIHVKGKAWLRSLLGPFGPWDSITMLSIGSGMPPRMSAATFRSLWLPADGWITVPAIEAGMSGEVIGGESLPRRSGRRGRASCNS